MVRRGVGMHLWMLWEIKCARIHRLHPTLLLVKLLLLLLLEHELVLHESLLLVLHLEELLVGRRMHETIVRLGERGVDLWWRAAACTFDRALRWRGGLDLRYVLVGGNFLLLDHLIVHALNDLGRCLHGVQLELDSLVLELYVTFLDLVRRHDLIDRVDQFSYDVPIHLCRAQDHTGALLVRRPGVHPLSYEVLLPVALYESATHSCLL